MLHDMLARIAQNYVYERAKPFANSSFGSFVRHDVAIEAKKKLIFLPYELTVKASVGAGVWAAVPWLAFFDPLVTKSATSGYYVVYLINAQTGDIYLSMNQGTTAIYNEFGKTRGQAVLRRRAVDISERVNDYLHNFSVEPIELDSDEPLPSGYMAGHAFGTRYNASEIDENKFSDDLSKMLAAYAALVERGGTTPSDVLQEESGSTDIYETRSYVLSRRIERSSNVRKPVFERRGLKCEGCGLEPIKHYGFEGRIENIPLDVHHSKPIKHLAEGESRRYKIPDDFLVLCPNCHRVIHKQRDPSDIDELRENIKFLLADKMTNVV